MTSPRLTETQLLQLEGLLIDALAQRLKSPGTSPMADLAAGAMSRLRDSRSSSPVTAADEPACRLLALHLLYDALSHDFASLDAHSRQAMLLLPDLATGESQAYLLFGLFFSTHNPQFRDAAKDYVRQHPHCSPTLRRYYGLSKKVRVRLRDAVTRNSLLQTAISGLGYQYL